MTPDTIINNQGSKSRDSNLELYRIICMLMIVAHHYVTSSGFTGAGGPIENNPHNINSLFLLVFGAWGKTGINCFVMITGYYMCKSKITIRKFLKLLLQVEFYKILFYLLFLGNGYENLTPMRLVEIVMPFWGFQNDFVSCFIAFYLLIPFLAILVNNMSKREHELLILLLFVGYTMLGSIPSFKISFNYITWFGNLFVLSSYIRLYPSKLLENKRIWGSVAIIAILLASLSIIVLHWYLSAGTFFVSDCNKLFAVVIGWSSFLFFKNIKIKRNNIINTISASTFGVLLIHANSSAMRQWLWRDFFNVTSWFTLPIWQLIILSLGGAIIVFGVCSLIDQMRIKVIEKPFFRWFDNSFLKDNE